MAVVVDTRSPGAGVAAWEAYAAGSEVEHFARFCSEHCVQSVDDWDGLPLDLEAFQERMLGEAMSFNELGLPVWRRIALILPRKNGKTCLLAAYALYRLLTSDGSPEILLAATTDKQTGRLYDAAASFVGRSPLLKSLLIVRAYKGQIVRKDGRGVILKASAESTDTDGFNPSLVICDELHNWETPSQRKTFAKLVSGGGARKAPQLFTITTAGEAQSREESILGRMLDGALAKGEVEREPGLEIARFHAGRTLVYNYTAPTSDPADVARMKLANPASWITERFLADAAAADDLTTEEVLRYHGGVWADATEAWIKRVAWDSCLVTGTQPPDGADVWVGVDASRTDDCTAVGYSWRLDDGRIGVAAYVWGARKGNACHEFAPGGVIDVRETIPFIVRLADRCRVVEVVYDPKYYEVPALMLSEDGFDVADAWGAGQNRAKAWTSWLTGVQTRMIAHDGDAVLAEHVIGAQARMTDQGWSVSKLRQRRSQKIDALVACAMAHWRCQMAPGEVDGYALDLGELDDQAEDAVDEVEVDEFGLPLLDEDW